MVHRVKFFKPTVQVSFRLQRRGQQLSLHGKLLRSLRLASPCRLVFQISVFMRVVRAVLVLLVRVLAAAVAAGLVSEPLR
jgi:hypothetical protein